MTAPSPPLPPLHWRELLRRKPRGEVFLGYAFIPPVCALVAWGLWALAGWLTWLYWPVVVVTGFSLVIFATAAINTLRMQVKRTDTATQTLRAASQGRIEVIGLLRPVEGTLLSPLHAVPCVAFAAWLTARDRAGTLVTFHEKTLPPAVLLTDGDRDAFLPMLDSHEVNTRVELERLDAPRDTLRQDVRDAVGEDGTISVRLEHVVPCDKPVQVNGVFRTLSSRDGYRTALAAHVDFLPPTDEELEQDAVERAWRTFCRRREAEAGDDGPVPVDAILPVTHFKGIGIVRVDDADWRHAADVIGMTVLFAAPFGYLLLRLLDLVEPLPLPAMPF